MAAKANLVSSVAAMVTLSGRHPLIFQRHPRGTPSLMAAAQRRDAATQRVVLARRDRRGRRRTLALCPHRPLESGVEATDSTGVVAGDFEPRGLRRGGTVRWGGRELALRPASAWRERYALADGERELALLDRKGWGKRPVKVSVDDADAVEPALLLFAAFVVRGLAEDAGSTAAAGASTPATGS
jgi:hypothetical protein